MKKNYHLAFIVPKFSMTSYPGMHYNDGMSAKFNALRGLNINLFGSSSIDAEYSRFYLERNRMATRTFRKKNNNKLVPFSTLFLMFTLTWITAS